MLWPDKERQWEPLLPRLRERLPVFTLGTYAPDQATGPAYWLRCIIARTIEHPLLAGVAVPILYLPGVSRQDVRAIETCPRALQPLAELQHRGVLWTQKNGRDWTIAAFLQSPGGGLGIEVASGTATREALGRALLKLADEPIIGLHGEAPIRAAFLNGLLHPDDVRDILRWMNDPTGFRATSSAEEWAAFVGLCQGRYGFHPEQDGPIAAARLLGQRKGSWEKVWRRFAEAPAAYAGLPERLRQAGPEQLPLLLESVQPREAWPQENEAAEAALQRTLLDLAGVDATAARAAIRGLEYEHGQRRGWVWSALRRTPLANALEHLAALAEETIRPLGGASPSEVAAAYVQRGWRADLALLDALAAVETPDDLAAVRAVARTVYRPWLEDGAVVMQKAVASGGTYAATLPSPTRAGTCLLFSDGLRYDAAQRLMEMLKRPGLECDLAAGLAALPSVTATAKPAVSPAADAFAGADDGLAPVLAASGTRVGIDVLRKALAAEGIQVLTGDALGDPAGRAWTELGNIDRYGHEYGWRVAHQLGEELRVLERRIAGLLEHGWRRVMVVTDHGWLLLPGGLPKAELPEHLTEVRKGRCARLKPGSVTEHQVVPWRWDPAVRFAVAPGIHCFEAGKEYEHGGLSPQECVVPILSVAAGAPAAEPVVIESVSWRRLRCTVAVKGAQPGLRVDLRTKAGDPATSLASGGKGLGADGTVAILVADEDREGQAALVVVLGTDGTPRAQTATVVGG